MDHTPHPPQPSTAAPAEPVAHCNACGKALSHRASFSFKRRVPEPPGLTHTPTEVIKCLPCALRHGPMLRRSGLAAIVVGTVLTLLNQGDLLVSGQWSHALYWKIPLTYCVPFLVATYGALTNSRR